MSRFSRLGELCQVFIYSLVGLELCQVFIYLQVGKSYVKFLSTHEYINANLPCLDHLGLRSMRSKGEAIL